VSTTPSYSTSIEQPLRDALRTADRGRPGTPPTSQLPHALLALDISILALVTAIVVLTVHQGRLGLGAIAVAVYPVGVLVALSTRGLYRRRLRIDVFDEIASVLGATAAVGMVLLVAALLDDRDNAADAVVRLWALSAALLSAGRASAAAVQRRARRRGAGLEPALIVGAGMVGHHVARRLNSHPEYGLLPLGFLDSNPPFQEADFGPPVIGSPDDLAELAQRHGARHVIVAFSSAPDRELVSVMRTSQAMGLGLIVIPRLFDAIGDRMELDHLGGMPVFGMRPVNPNGLHFAAKHAFDRVGAAILLFLLAPLLLTLATLVKLNSPGPVLFRQRRVGRDGHPFDLLKFRSMADPVDEEEFELQDGAAPGGIEGADRRTPVGRLLRRTSLDELPQLLNVLMGEMSLVGPRPERPEYVALFQQEINRYGERHRVRAGMTGWAQVHGLRGQTSIADRAEWDNYYIENWSMRLDLKILLMTLLTVFRRAE
jgi:exopolysaccharide biosynthesis polyprenyl glycosylphosphotransferase